jgi:hypothetical protein
MLVSGFFYISGFYAKLDCSHACIANPLSLCLGLCKCCAILDTFFRLIMNDADARRPVCRLIIQAAWSSDAVWKSGLVFTRSGHFASKGITINRVTVHHVHIAVHWMVHIPLGMISYMTRTGCFVCPDVRRFVNANMGCICSWRLIIPPWFATIRRPRCTLICQQNQIILGGKIFTYPLSNPTELAWHWMNWTVNCRQRRGEAGRRASASFIISPFFAQIISWPPIISWHAWGWKGTFFFRQPRSIYTCRLTWNSR